MAGPPRVLGLIEGVFDGIVWGWAFDSRSPRSRLAIRLTDQDGRSAVVSADRYRADLRATGIGDGHYGFSVSESRFPEFQSLSAKVEGHDFELPNYCRGSGAPQAIQQAGWYKFQIDPRHPAGSALKGWVVNLADPLERCRVRLLDAGATCSETTACRRHAGVPGPFDHYHGFVVDCPPARVGPITIGVLEAGETFSALTVLP